ncbi:MAG: C1 family peptidase [Pyrinomonadaceae bacterium]
MRKQSYLKAIAVMFVVSAALVQSAVISQSNAQRIAQGATQTTAQMPRQAIYQQRELIATPAIKARLAALRAEMKTKGLKFSVGYTAALDRSLEQLTGLVLPRDLGTQAIRHSAVARQLDSIDNAARDEYARRANPNLYELRIADAARTSSFDWRKQGKVTPVRDQGGCGSCWAFAALGAYEGSYLIRNGSAADASEQDVLDCGKAGDCKGGRYTQAFDYLSATGDASETSYASYKAAQGTCSAVSAPPLRAVAWDYVTHDTIPGTPNSRVPTVSELKQALTTYGPLAVSVLVTPSFEAYTGGDEPFNEPKSEGEEYVTPPDKSYPQGQKFKVDSDGRPYAVDPINGKFYVINHAVTLIGWDDAKQAWLIKNSWGTYWGDTCGYGDERGYMWINYKTNNIGYAAAWVKAKSNFYQLPPQYLTILKTTYPDRLITMPVQNLRELPVVDAPKKPVTPAPKPTVKN